MKNPRLEREYDAQADIVDDPYPSERSHLFPPKSMVQGVPPGSGLPPRYHRGHVPGHTGTEGLAPIFTTTAELSGPVDFRADEDPLGLWQSMNFASPYSFPPGSAKS